MTRLLVVTLLLAAVAVGVMLRNRGTTTSRTVRITARAGFSRSATIAVVEVDGRRLLVGVAPNAVTLLTELDPADATAADPAPTAPAPVEPIPPHHVPRSRPAPDIAPAVALPSTAGAGGALDRLRGMTVRTVGATRVQRGVVP